MLSKFPIALKYIVKVGYLNISFFMHESLANDTSSEIVTPHNHHNCELRYVVRGTSSAEFENGEVSLEAGDFILIPSMTYHHVQTDNNNTTGGNIIAGLRFSFEPPTAGKKQETTAYNAAKKLFSSLRKLHDESGSVLTFLSAVSDEIENRKLGYITAIQSYSALLFTEIFRLLDKESEIFFPTDEPLLNGKDYLKIEDFFNRNYSRSEMTAAECAESLNISRRQLDRIMYKLYGVSFSENLKNTRLKKAVYLLKYSNETVINISKECGFATYSAFYSSFKQKYQISPSDFRSSVPKHQENSLT